MIAYEEIIHLPHHISERHARMSMTDRAAQFSPFAALTGHDAAIRETARVTQEYVELTEEEKLVLDGRLRIAAEERCSVRITYFLHDKKKTGGAYVCTSGKITRVDLLRAQVQMDNGISIPIDDIFDIDTD